MVIIGTCNGRRNRIFVSTAYRTAEAAAVGYDRAAIAVFGRDMAVLNNPLADYPPEVGHSHPCVSALVTDVQQCDRPEPKKLPSSLSALWPVSAALLSRIMSANA